MIHILHVHLFSGVHIFSSAFSTSDDPFRVATLDKPAFETVLQLAAEEMPAEVGMPFIAPRPGISMGFFEMGIELEEMGIERWKLDL